MVRYCKPWRAWVRYNTLRYGTVRSGTVQSGAVRSGHVGLAGTQACRHTGTLIISMCKMITRHHTCSMLHGIHH